MCDTEQSFFVKFASKLSKFPVSEVYNLGFLEEDRICQGDLRVQHVQGRGCALSVPQLYPESALICQHDLSCIDHVLMIQLVACRPLVAHYQYKRQTDKQTEHCKGSTPEIVSRFKGALPKWGGGSQRLPGWFGALIQRSSNGQFA